MNADSPREWLATCPRALASVLRAELEALGAEDCKEQAAAVSFRGTRAVMYRACLWSRVASRVLLPLGQGAADSADELYRTVQEFPWPQLLRQGASFAIDFHGTNRALRNTRFGAQRSKDAVMDRFRASGLTPPPVRPENPDIRIQLRLRGARLDLALDMAGESLHRRGYRRGTGDAPLKENLAAAMLLRAGWPALAERGGALLDPMCGSATLLIEGAMMAADMAPALGRERFGFQAWGDHDDAQWAAIVADARGRRERGHSSVLPEIRGYDANPRVIRRAQENIAAAGLEKAVRVSVKSLAEVTRPTHRPLPLGLVISNPPYGERLGDREALPMLYRHLGELLHREFQGWEAAILTGDKALGKALGLRSHRQHDAYNGALPVTLVLLSLGPDNRLRDLPPPMDGDARNDPWAGASASDSPAPESIDAMNSHPGLSPGAEMFANRLRKNQRRLASWLKRSGVTCYRLYDADMPEYAVAVDRYEDWLHVAEYRPPASVSADAAAQRLAEVRAALPSATGVPRERIVFKRRERQRGQQQYQRRGQGAAQLLVHEDSAQLLVNLHDYLDTGLFLDHRPLRRRIAAEASGRRFLNLFCYTGSATIHAALAGARETVSVDLSNAYLRWLAQNIAQNGLAESRHHMVREDVLKWLRSGTDTFDIILLDPPSFSNSKKVVGSFDVQRDHGGLIDLAMARLAPEGVLYFSNNRRKFQLNAQVSERYRCEDITAKTLDPDFKRAPPPHRCWRLQHHSDPAGTSS